MEKIKTILDFGTGKIPVEISLAGDATAGQIQAWDTLVRMTEKGMPLTVVTVAAKRELKK